MAFVCSEGKEHTYNAPSSRVISGQFYSLYVVMGDEPRVKYRLEDDKAFAPNPVLVSCK